MFADAAEGAAGTGVGTDEAADPFLAEAMRLSAESFAAVQAEQLALEELTILAPASHLDEGADRAAGGHADRTQAAASAAISTTSAGHTMVRGTGQTSYQDSTLSNAHQQPNVATGEPAMDELALALLRSMVTFKHEADRRA